MRHCVIALLLLLGASPAVSDDATATDSLETLKFNVSSGGYPPYTIVYPDGTVSGIFWEVVSIIAQRLNLRLESVQLPPMRSDSLLQEGYSDVTMRAIEWTKTPEDFVFTDPVMMTRDAIFSHNHSTRTIRHIDDLDGTMLTRLGFNYPWLQEKLDSGVVSLIPVQAQEPMFRRLYHGGGRFTGAVSNQHAGYWVLKNHPRWRQDISEAPIRLDEVAYRLMFSPRHAELVPEINRELARLRESGELERIIRSYR